mgnify:CR=1 FL=1
MFRLIALSLAVAMAPAMADGDPAAGRKLASQCAVCHGVDGIARQPHVPHIAGESVIYLTKQLKAFRAGEREDPQMTLMAKPLSDEDIANLSAWYASIRISAEMPE